MIIGISIKRVIKQQISLVVHPLKYALNNNNKTKLLHGNSMNFNICFVNTQKDFLELTTTQIQML